MNIIMPESEGGDLPAEEQEGLSPEIVEEGGEQELQEDKAESRFVLKRGAIVSVERSSGEVEKDWTIGGFNPETGDAIVQKPDPDNEGGFLEKEVPRDNLYELNPPKRSFGEWHNIWVQAGGDRGQQFDLEHWEKREMSAAEAWDILRRGRQRLVTPGESQAERVFESYLYIQE